tara:strand:- start:191 stop:484 length:294 start_codon:yes stop_codon:yes gene_type:complete
MWPFNIKEIKLLRQEISCLESEKQLLIETRDNARQEAADARRNLKNSENRRRVMKSVMDENVEALGTTIRELKGETDDVLQDQVKPEMKYGDEENLW